MKTWSGKLSGRMTVFAYSWRPG
uniref:Uncharacterized protein n=1 Tax=Arundo donax TaxID=35708 RepID=A0A0A8ZW46_ARUDO